MNEFKIIPNKSVGEFYLGMEINDSINILLEGYPIYQNVEISYNPINPFSDSVDIKTINLELKFNSNQRLFQIIIFLEKIKKLKVGEMNSTSTKLEDILKLFGYAFKPDKTNIIKYENTEIHFNENLNIAEKIILNSEKIKKLSKITYDGFSLKIPNCNESLNIGSSIQKIILLIGYPNFDKINQNGRLISFYNLGIDFGLDKSNCIRNIILHSNLPSRADFSIYKRCNFDLLNGRFNISTRLTPGISRIEGIGFICGIDGYISEVIIDRDNECNELMEILCERDKKFGSLSLSFNESDFQFDLVGKEKVIMKFDSLYDSWGTVDEFVVNNESEDSDSFKVSDGPIHKIIRVIDKTNSSELNSKSEKEDEILEKEKENSRILQEFPKPENEEILEKEKENEILQEFPKPENEIIKQNVKINNKINVKENQNEQIIEIQNPMNNQKLLISNESYNISKEELIKKPKKEEFEDNLQELENTLFTSSNSSDTDSIEFKVEESIDLNLLNFHTIEL